MLIPHPPLLPLIPESFLRLTGRPLLDAGFAPPSSPAMAGEGGMAQDQGLARALWEAPRVILAHGTEADPVFFYGNRLALQVFAMDFAAFTRLPSRFSAEPLARDERARLLDRVSRDGFIDDYAGVRISATGQRFRIEQAVVWNLVDAAGVCHGQAATFDCWTPLD